MSDDLTIAAREAVEMLLWVLDETDDLSVAQENQVLAAADRLEAALDAEPTAPGAGLVEAAERMLEWYGDHPDGPSVWYDEQAERFHRETGVMAPGKDAPAGYSIGAHDDRRERWHAWCEQRGSFAAAALRTALAAHRQRQQEPPRTCATCAHASEHKPDGIDDDLSDIGLACAIFGECFEPTFFCADWQPRDAAGGKG
jgi:hypothetical protein